MANVLKMATVNSITTLVQAGYSDRRIADALGVDRGTVAKYRKQIQNPPKAPPGTTSDPPPQATGDPPPADSGDLPKPRTGPESLCEPHRELILSKLDQGLCAKRIWQDLVDEQNFLGRYHSVRRFVGKLSEQSPELVRRMEVAPGEEAQIDFGTAAVVKQPEGKTRRPWVLRVVLSHSRKAYSEAVYQQTTENFIRVLENAFRYFGGVPKTLVSVQWGATTSKRP